MGVFYVKDTIAEYSGSHKGMAFFMKTVLLILCHSFLKVCIADDFSGNGIDDWMFLLGLGL